MCVKAGASAYASQVSEAKPAISMLDQLWPRVSQQPEKMGCLPACCSTAEVVAEASLSLSMDLHAGSDQRLRDVVICLRLTSE